MTKHEACLARIDALERELFPHWFPAEPKRELEKMTWFGGYAEALTRLSWKTDPKNGGLIPSPREAIPHNMLSSASSWAPGTKWLAQDHDDIRVAPNYTQIVESPKKRIILP